MKLEAESASRAERRLLAKTRLAHFPFHKTLSDFDFRFQPSIDRKEIQELATLPARSCTKKLVTWGSQPSSGALDSRN